MTARKLKKVARCAVCSSPDRSLIEAAKIAGCSLNSIAEKYQISRDSIWRHMTRHVSDDLKAQYIADIPVAEMAKRAADEEVKLLDYLSIVRSTLLQQFQTAAAVGDRNATGLLAGKLIEACREIGKLTGELSSMSVNNLSITNNVAIMNSPAFASLQAVLLTALSPFPEARAAVVQALRQMEEPTPMKTIDHRPATQFLDGAALNAATGNN